MSARPQAALARWQRSLQLLAAMPPEITANEINDRLLADVARLVRPDPAAAVELRVVILWAVNDPEAGLVDQLAGELYGSVPGASPVLSVLTLPSATPGSLVREELAGAHAVVVAAGYYDLVLAEPPAAAGERLAAAAPWVAWIAGRLSHDHVTIAVHGRTTRRSDAVSRSDWVRQMAVGRLSVPPAWPPGVLVETGPDAVPGTLAARVLQPFRADLMGTFEAMTYDHVKRAVRGTERRCATIRQAAGAGVPAGDPWIRVQAHAAGSVARTVAAVLDASDPAGER